MSNAIANQLYLAYLGRPADTAWRSSTTALLNGAAPPVALQNAFYSAAVIDGTFSLTDSSSTLVNKIFLNVFGFAASTFEQNAWAVLINNGTITAQTAAWTIFSSYLGATNVPAAYQQPAQSKLLVIDAYTNELANQPSANLALSSLGSTTATSVRTFLSTISSQATAAPAITGIATTVSSNTSSGSTFALTTAVDSITGTTGNDTINATDGTYTGLDVINGGTGIDSLNVNDVTGAAFVYTNATVTNVEKLVVKSTTGLNAGAIDISANSALTDATFNLNAAAAAQTVTASATLSTLTLTNSTAQTLAVIGGAGVLSITNGAAAVTVGGTAVSNGYTSASVKGGTTVAISDKSGGTTAAPVVGKLLTTASVDGNTGAATITSDGLTALSVANTAAAATATVVGAHTLGLTLSGVTGGTITDATATTINVTGVTKASSALTISGAAATAATFGGTVAISTALTMAALKTATITGSGGVTADVSGIGVLTAVDASASTGANKITIDSTKATYAGGSGADTVIIAAVPTKSIDGGAGTADVLTLNVASGTFNNPSANTNLKGFEILGLGAAATGSYDATGFTGLTEGAVAAAVTYTNVAAGAGLAITANPGFATTYVLKDATGTSDSLAITLTASGAGITAGAVTAAGIEAVSISATDTAAAATAGGQTSTITLVATAAKTITITGNDNVTLTNTGNTAVTSIDASALTGGLTVTTAGTVAETVKGGAKANTLTAAAGAIADTLIGGAAVDTLTSNSGSTTLTGGAGADSFVISTAGANVNTYTTITDASTGDVITFLNKAAEALNGGTLTTAKVSLAATAVFQDYANAVIAAGGDASTNGAVGWFQFNGDTYIVESAHNGATTPSFTNGTDQVIKLTGLIDLTKATFVSGAAAAQPTITIG